jgi:hypothetical protein
MKKTGVTMIVQSKQKSDKVHTLLGRSSVLDDTSLS